MQQFQKNNADSPQVLHWFSQPIPMRYREGTVDQYYSPTRLTEWRATARPDSSAVLCSIMSISARCLRSNVRVPVSESSADFIALYSVVSLFDSTSLVWSAFARIRRQSRSVRRSHMSKLRVWTWEGIREGHVKRTGLELHLWNAEEITNRRYWEADVQLSMAEMTANGSSCRS